MLTCTYANQVNGNQEQEKFGKKTIQEGKDNPEYAAGYF